MRLLNLQVVGLGSSDSKVNRNFIKGVNMDKLNLKRMAELGIVMTAIAALVVGCGGGSSGSSSSNNNGTSTGALSGIVADGYIGGAKVCLDVGNDGMCDPTDPSATTSSNGSYSIPSVTAASAAASPIIVEIPANATDTDTPGSTVGQAYTLAAHAGKGAFVSPLTTLIKAKIDAGSSVAEAEASVKATLGISTASVYDDYIAKKTGEHTTAHNAARVVGKLFRDGLAALGGTTLDADTLRVLAEEADATLLAQKAGAGFDLNALASSVGAAIPGKVADRRYDVALAAGTTGMRSITINFGVLAQNGAASAVLGTDICAKSLTLGSGNTAGQVNDLRFFISNLSLVDHDGVKHPVVLDENTFQSKGVALLDFENASAVGLGGTIADAATNKCAGTTATNTVITGKVADGHHYHGLAFELGVPVKSVGTTKVDLNHANGATAGILPLATAGMSWNWQSGKKFTKIQYVPNGGLFNGASAVAATTWNLHLGSTACSLNPASAVLPNTYECGAPNRVPFVLESGNFIDAVAPGAALTANQTVVLDLVELFKTADVSQETGGAPGCMSGATDPQCPAIFNALQLNAGRPTGTPSAVFKLQ